MRHGPVWHYLLEVGHFHYMMDEHISEYSSFEAHLCLFSVTYWGIPPSLGSFNLPQVSFTFQSSCWPFWVAILGHTPFLQEHQTFHKLHSLFDLVVDPRELHTGVYPPSQESLDLSKASLSFDLVVDPHELPYWGISPPIEFTCIVILVILWLWATWSSSCLFEFSLSFGVAPTSINHIPISLCLVWVLGPHLYRSVIILSVWVCVLGSHPYRLTIFLSVCVQFESGPHLYRSVIILSFWVCILGPHPYQSTIFLSVCVQFESGLYLYQSIIILSAWVCAFWGRTHIDRPYFYHFVFSLSQDRTYIDWPYSYSFVFSLSRDCTYIDQSLFCQIELSLVCLRVVLA